MTENYSKEALVRPEKPSLYIFKGVSGAGVSTAIRAVVDEGLVRLSPPEFTTRPLRPGEIKGDRHHPISEEQLAMVEKQVALLEVSYGNKYGFFKPAIRRIQQMLSGENVVVDSATPPQKWRDIMDEGTNIVSLFFAPENPFTAIDRIAARAPDDPRLRTYLPIRARANQSVIEQLRNFDYWINTSYLDSVKPSVKNLIGQTSYGSHKNSDAVKVDDNMETVERLIQTYQEADIDNYLESLGYIG